MLNRFYQVFVCLFILSSANTYASSVTSNNLQPVADPSAVVTLGNARFTVLTEKLIRLEYSDNGTFEDSATQVIINRKLPVPEFSQQISDSGELLLETRSLSLHYNPEFAGFTDNNLHITLDLNGESVSWRPGKVDKQNLLGTSRTLDGMNGGIDWNGQPLQLEQGLLSRSGWSLLDDSQSLVMDQSDWQWIQARENAQLDWYFFGHGHDYKAALYDFTQVAGKIPMPPRYAFGYWWSRYWAYSDAELRKLISTMRNYEIPIDVLVIDMDWHLTHDGLKDIKNPQRDPFGELVGWTGYTWNKDLFPEPEQFLDWTQEANLKTALNLHPASGIPPMEEQYHSFAQAYGFDTSDENYIPYRMADKSWAQVYSDTILTPLENQGVDFWWLDWQQFPESKVLPGLSNTWWLNHVFFTDMERKGHRPMLFHRWGGMGNHRYQIGFSGDDKISWESLQYQTYFTPTASNVGYGYWSHDIGGHAASDYAKDAELYLRWIQFGIFSPVFRTHSAKISTIERRFWMYPEYFGAMRELVQWRYKLNPYIYRASRQAYDTGVSVLRPMYYDYPKAEQAYQFKYQYLFGDDILVAPVTAPVDKSSLLVAKNIWFPEGKWYDWSQGKMITGGKVLTLSYTESEVPIFVKAGSIIPEYPQIEHLQSQHNEFVLTVIPGDSGAVDLYEDNGEDLGYKRGEFATTHITHEHKDAGHTILIEAREGSYTGAPQTRKLTIRLPATLPLRNLLINGKAPEEQHAGWHYDAQNLANVIELPEADTSQPWRVTFDHHREGDSLAQSKVGQFRRVSKAIADLKIEIARENWWATFPNVVFAAEQTPTKIAYQPGDAHMLLMQYDEHFKGLLKEITLHKDIRKPVADRYTAFLSR